MTEREVFLNHLAEASGRPRHQLVDHPFIPINSLPQTTLSDLSADELLNLAQTRSEALQVEFHLTSQKKLPQVLNVWLKAQQAQNILLPTDPRLSEYGLDQWLAHLTPTPRFWQPNAGRATNLDAASHADAAISVGDYLLAESGTLTVATTRGQGRAFHFLPTHYLSIIPRSHVVPRSYQAMKAYRHALQNGTLQTSNINFISGPSNSGDIEMVLIVGVHGPLTVSYVVIDDA
ncbi:LutC/YkgG family protein [Lacticaseibacillus porcinae]|uniref:LutC/YkgG family protein n=1 Tax=Lacticaseibacillus porcinae TaxID=1123687 RepID=UPI000F770AAF|nr:lactate utilization protein C [Lacticaseibacillus porcinae]